MISEEITKDLRAGMGLDECLKKHNTNLKQLFPDNRIREREIKKDRVLGGYIYRSGDNYRIRKMVNKHQQHFGTYTDPGDAMCVRDELKKIGWKQDQVVNICERLGVKSRVRGRHDEKFSRNVNIK